MACRRRHRTQTAWIRVFAGIIPVEEGSDRLLAGSEIRTPAAADVGGFGDLL
jgi:hypothetical protein